MIERDQPRCFPRDVLASVSSRDDGTVLDRAVGIHNPEMVTNRTRFCEEQGVSYGDVVYQRIIYGEDQSYDRIAQVGTSDTCSHIDEIQADALVTDEMQVGLLLPVADCVATIIYDGVARRLALVHLGRHSTIANLMTKTLEHMQARGSRMEDMVVWMAPAVQQAHYRMEYFNHSNESQWVDHCEQRDEGYYLDLPGYNRARAIELGVSPARIHTSSVDTATDSHYFSHSQGDTSGRFAVLAMMRARSIN